MDLEKIKKKYSKEIFQLSTETLKKEIPQHIAIIMDGNGRWAKKRHRPRIEGHRQGIKTVKKISNFLALYQEVKILTLYAFSTENWARPEKEVNTLMKFFKFYLNKELKNMMKNNVKFMTIGDISKLPDFVVEEIKKVKKQTENNNGYILNIAVNYGSRQEIVRAVKYIKQNKKIEEKDINEELIKKYLWTKNLPDHDLLIRTSGEYRISNFLLWQTAYTEFYFTDILWPDFDEKQLLLAILDYQKRERRFGKA